MTGQSVAPEQCRDCSVRLAYEREEELLPALERNSPVRLTTTPTKYVTGYIIDEALARQAADQVFNGQGDRCTGCALQGVCALAGTIVAEMSHLGNQSK